MIQVHHITGSDEQNRLWLLLVVAIISASILITQKVLASDRIEKAGDILQILIPAIALGSTFYLEDSDGGNSWQDFSVDNTFLESGQRIQRHSYPYSRRF